MATSFDWISNVSMKGLAARSGVLYGVAEEGLFSIDTSTGAIITKVSDVGGHAIAYDGDADRFFVSGKMLGNSVVLWVNTSGVINSVFNSQHYDGLCYDMGFLYGVNRNGTWKVTVADGTTVKLSDVSGFDCAICATELYVADKGRMWECAVADGEIDSEFDELDAEAIGYDIVGQKLWASDVHNLYSIDCASGGGGGPSSDDWLWIQGVPQDSHLWIGPDNAVFQ